MFFSDYSHNSLVAQGTAEIIEAAQADKAFLRVTSYSIANASGGYLYGGRMVGKVAIWNMKTTDFHGKVRLQLWIQKDGDDYVSGGTILTKEIDVPANQTIDVDFEYNDLKEGHSYYLPVNYVDQEGELSGANIWSHSWRVMPGIISWNGDGTVAGQPYQTNISIDSTACGLYADYTFHGTTLTPTVCNCYVLNAEGTAFEYTATDRQLTGLSTYFTTTRAEADRPGSILLPECTAVTGIHPYDDATALSSPTGEGSGVRPEFRGGLFDLGGKLHPHGGNRNVKSGIYIVGGKKVVVK